VVFYLHAAPVAAILVKGGEKMRETRRGESQTDPLFENLRVALMKRGGSKEVADWLNEKREWLMHGEDERVVTVQLPRWEAPKAMTELEFSEERTVKISEASLETGLVEIGTLENVKATIRLEKGIIFVSENGAAASLSEEGKAHFWEDVFQIAAAAR